MADKVECTLYPNDDGSPKLYDFAYIFDDGYGNFSAASVTINAKDMQHPADAVEARNAADVAAKKMKSEWLAGMLIKPQPAKVSSVAQEFDLGANDPRTPEQKKALADKQKADADAAQASTQGAAQP